MSDTSDTRPNNCRFRLQDERKPYPRSSCTACGKNIATGLGNRCLVAETSAATALTAQDKEIDALRADCQELRLQAICDLGQLQEALGRAETAERRVAELEKQREDFLDPTLKSFRLEDGRFDMSLAGDVVQRVALVLTTWFRESGAKNYVEIRINAKDAPFESYVFSVQKVGDGGKTPHELRETAERERDEARAALKRILFENDAFRACLPANCESDPLNDACAAARAVIEQGE